jgi:hypothetical protein
MSSFNQGVPGVATLINSSAVLVTGNAASANALTVRQFGGGNVFSAQTTTGSTALFVGANGNVGVGTASPSFGLDVYGTTSAAGTIRALTTSQGSGVAGSQLRLMEASDSYGFAFQNINALRLGLLYYNGAAGVECMSVRRDNGYVGIGTASPGELLHVYGGNIRLGSTGTASVFNSYTGSDFGNLSLISGYQAASSAPRINIVGYTGANTVNGDNIIQLATNGSTRVTINQSGNVGIGTASPGRALHVYSGGTSGPFVVDQSASFSDTVILVRASQVSGTTYNLAVFQANGGADTRVNIRGDGNIYNVNGVYGAISDRHLKENIVPARSYMDDLNKLQVVKFSFKAEESPVPTQLGLIAQDVEQVFPGLVDTDKDGNKNLKYSILNMMMLKTVQELSTENTALEQSLATATANVSSLKTQMAAMEQSLATATANVSSLDARLAALEAKLNSQ